MSDGVELIRDLVEESSRDGWEVGRAEAGALGTATQVMRKGPLARTIDSIAVGGIVHLAEHPADASRDAAPEKDPARGILLRAAAAEGLHGKTFAAAAARPPGYPAALPFVPGVVAVGVAPPGPTALVWFASPEAEPDAAAVAASVQSQLAEDGWAAEPAEAPAVGVSGVVLRKNGRERELLRARPMVMLLEKAVTTSNETERARRPARR